MNRSFLAISLITIAAITMGNSGCDTQPTAAEVQKNTQKAAAEQAAASLQFSENSEIENIKRRLELTSKPGQLGFVMLLNEMGQPILYEGVKGKITSSSKRLTPTDKLSHAGNGNGGYSLAVRQEASDEGTYGSSDPYIYYWNVDGAYRQWSGRYLYSDQPMRLRQDPLIVNTK